MAMCSAAVFIILKLKVRMIARKAMLMIATLRIVTMMNVSAAVYRGGAAGAGRTSWVGRSSSSSSSSRGGGVREQSSSSSSSEAAAAAPASPVPPAAPAAPPVQCWPPPDRGSSIVNPVMMPKCLWVE